MALLVCFHDAGSAVNWSNKAIYLDQGFYELLFDYYKGHRNESPLKGMVAIGYDEEFIIAGSQIEESLTELARIASEGKVQHPQLQSLRNVLREAASRNCQLAIAGDMYPDLSRTS